MNFSTPNIFLSYSWRNENIADELDNTFTSVGLYIQRDKRDVPYRGNLEEFMQRIAKADFVLMILSDEYLRRINCMYEVTELLNTHELRKKILPVLHENVIGIFNWDGRKIYYDFWEGQVNKAKTILDQHTNDDYLNEWKKCKSIYDSLGEFFQQIKHLKAETFNDLKEKNYKPILDIVGFDEYKIVEEAISINNIIDTEERDIELEKFANRYRNNRYSLFIQAYYESKQQQFKKARLHYEQLITMFPDHFLAYNNLGVILQHDFLDFKEAKENYKKAIQINALYFDAHSNLATLLHNELTCEMEAKEQYEIAIKIKPNDEVLHYNLAILLSDKFSEYIKAKDHYLYAIYIRDDFAEAHYNLALLFKEHFDNYDSAKTHYIKSIKLNLALKSNDLDDYFFIIP